MALELAIEARNLYRFFHAGDDEVLALQGVSLDVATGEFVAVMGPSGSGKSTLLSCVAGLDEPDGGTVQIAGHVMTRRSEVERAQLRAQHVGLLFQVDNLIPHLDLDANLRIIQRLARLTRARGAPENRASQRRDLLERLGLASRSHALPSQLSGGEAARAGLAAALINDPPVVLADEPTGELDGETEAAILTLLREDAAAGRAILVATHSDAVARSAQRVVTLVDGRVTYA